MRILVACEESQRVCTAFRKLGHEAFSCDIMDCSGGKPEWHLKGNVLDFLDDGWDMMVGFPPCTYLSNAGARHLYPKGKLNMQRFEKGLEAREFFMALWNAPIKHIALENPTPSRIYDLPTSTQVIQPYQFGEPYSKRTLLWLKNLPNLMHTKVLDTYEPYIQSSSHRAGNKPPTKKDSRQRSKTFVGIANAMADQWSTPKYVEQLSLFDMY